VLLRALWEGPFGGKVHGRYLFPGRLVKTTLARRRSFIDALAGFVGDRLRKMFPRR